MPAEAKSALTAINNAEIISISLVVLCELLWVLKRGCKKSRDEILETVRYIVNMERVEFDRPAVEAGLAMLEAGGDFADGVIAFEGRRLGGETFVTFDRKAASVLTGAGNRCLLLSADPR